MCCWIIKKKYKPVFIISDIRIQFQVNLRPTLVRISNVLSNALKSLCNFVYKILQIQCYLVVISNLNILKVKILIKIYIICTVNSFGSAIKWKNGTVILFITTIFIQQYIRDNRVYDIWWVTLETNAKTCAALNFLANIVPYSFNFYFILFKCTKFIFLTEINPRENAVSRHVHTLFKCDLEFSLFLVNNDANRCHFFLYVLPARINSPCAHSTRRRD